MKKISFLLLLIPLLIFTTAFTGKCGKGDDKKAIDNFYKEADKAIVLTRKKDWREFSYTTPKGVAVQTEDAIPPDKQAEQLAMIDAGLDRYFFATEKYNYQNYRKHSDFRVAMVRKSHDSINGYGLLTTSNGISTGGTVLGVGITSGISVGSIIIAQNWEYPKYVREIVRNEADHFNWFNDRARYDLFTGENDTHPQDPLPDDEIWRQSD